VSGGSKPHLAGGHISTPFSENEPDPFFFF
jgi:hypothetical protein